MMKLAFPIFLTVAAGASIVIQQVLNTNLRTALSSAVWSGFTSYFVGLICMVTNEDAPAGAFTLGDVPGVAVVVEKAVGTKCARSWKILPTVGSDPEYPDVSPRDAEALREWKALGVGV